MAIKAIIFDCFGVLVKSGRNLFRQDFPEFNDLVDELCAKSDLGILERDYFNDILAEKTHLTSKEIDDRYWGSNKFDYDVINMVKNFKSSGEYKIGLLSNISRDWMGDILQFFDKEGMFDEIILSGDIHLIKPDPNIFKMMAEKLNVLPEECVMIDDLADNINGARIAGMHGIVFFSPEQVKEDLNNLLDMNNA